MPINASGVFDTTTNYTDPTTVATGATRSAPTLVTQGMNIVGCTGFRIIISADSGQTLSGAGTVRIWLWSLLLTRWVHNSTLDYDISVTAATWRDDVTPDMPCSVGYGRVFPQVVGVTSSSGNITTQAEGGVLE